MQLKSSSTHTHRGAQRHDGRRRNLNSPVREREPQHGPFLGSLSPPRLGLTDPLHGESMGEGPHSTMPTEGLLPGARDTLWDSGQGHFRTAWDLPWDVLRRKQKWGKGQIEAVWRGTSMGK